MPTFFLLFLPGLNLKMTPRFETCFFLSLKKEYEGCSMVEPVRLESKLISNFVIVKVQTKSITADYFAEFLT